mmetsp:Transcript_32461/g.49670  ORF Transcript_32461/g.49670 Transcript_32461/m.49670 type:complete len:123 (+) Transcript_32461:317-685(+)
MEKSDSSSDEPDNNRDATSLTDIQLSSKLKKLSLDISQDTVTDRDIEAARPVQQVRLRDSNKELIFSGESSRRAGEGEVFYSQSYHQIRRDVYSIFGQDETILCVHCLSGGKINPSVSVCNF